MADYHSQHTGQVIDATISAVIAGKAGIQGVKVNGTEITPDSSTNKVDINIPSAPTVVQTNGTSTTDVMSQNAVTNELSSKVDQVSGKGLSTNDFTNTYKTKLDGISNNATRTKVNSYSMILTAANWSSTAPYTYTINSESTISSDEPIFDIELSSNTSTAISELESWGYVSKADTSNGQITFTCLETKPTVDLPVKMLVIKNANEW